MHTIELALLEDFALSRDGVPIYVQIRDHFAAAIRQGYLGPGAQMPTMRQVAVMLRVDINTVRHAYDDLERAGLISLERGRGSFVTEHPTKAVDDGALTLDDIARQTIAAAQAADVDIDTLCARIAALAGRKES